MKYGVNTLLWTAGFDQSNLDLLPRIKEWGFDGVEIARFSFDGCAPAPIRRALEANGLECTLCTALTGGLMMGADDGKAVEHVKEAARWGAEIGAKLVIGPFCSAVGYLPGRRRTTDEWVRCVDALRSLAPVLADTDVTLAIEPLNRFETFFLNTAADARRLCEEVADRRIGAMIDTFHANIEEASVGRAVDATGPYLRHVHTCENDRGVPGSGHIAWRELFSALRRQQYDEWLVIESFGFAIPEIAAAACIWRDLAPSVDAIASEGVKFLKQQAQSVMLAQA